MQPRLDGPDRRPRKLLNFIEFVAFSVVQQYDDAVIFAELLQCCVQAAENLDALTVRDRVEVAGKACQTLAGQVPLVDEVHALAGETAMLIDEQVVHDPAQPGTRLLDFHDFVQQAEGLDKQFLEQVLGLGFATGQAPGKTIQPVEVRPHDSLEYVALVCFSHRTAECIASRGASDKDALCYS